MSCLLSLLLASLLPAAEQARPQSSRYLKRANGKFVLESEITETRGAGGTTFVSRTERPGEKMTLTLHGAPDGRLKAAQVVQVTRETRRTAEVTFSATGATLVQDGARAHVLLGVQSSVVVTTAPDWSDIIQLARRYDRRKGGRQRFAGLWIHPVKPARVLTFTIERRGKDTIKVKDRTVVLERYRIRLRSGAYLAWTDGSGRVYKLMVPGKPASAVVLEGCQEETRGLGTSTKD